MLIQVTLTFQMATTPYADWLQNDIMLQNQYCKKNVIFHGWAIRCHMLLFNPVLYYYILAHYILTLDNDIYHVCVPAPCNNILAIPITLYIEHTMMCFARTLIIVHHMIISLITLYKVISFIFKTMNYKTSHFKRPILDNYISYIPNRFMLMLNVRIILHESKLS
jgi:hypothetical protein